MTPIPSAFALLHQVFVLDAYLKRRIPAASADKLVRSLVSDLLKTLHMQELGPLQIYPATDPRAPGWSFLQAITTSHISGHYFDSEDSSPHIRIDIYSCTTVQWHKAIDTLHKHLVLGEWRATFIDRQIDDTSQERLILDIHGNGAEVLDEQKLSVQNSSLYGSKRSTPTSA
ncbi:MAG: S-adenosylmethionine decarboxylase [Candidatus Peribacteraceae bacterium]|nr:S-adenosylmethionine decarboxylase [Candidatus Peribacteraceae bacterium]